MSTQVSVSTVVEWLPIFVHGWLVLVFLVLAVFGLLSAGLSAGDLADVAVPGVIALGLGAALWSLSGIASEGEDNAMGTVSVIAQTPITDLLASSRGGVA